MKTLTSYLWKEASVASFLFVQKYVNPRGEVFGIAVNGIKKDGMINEDWLRKTIEDSIQSAAKANLERWLESREIRVVISVLEEHAEYVLVMFYGEKVFVKKSNRALCLYARDTFMETELGSFPENEVLEIETGIVILAGFEDLEKITPEEFNRVLFKKKLNSDSRLMNHLKELANEQCMEVVCIKFEE